MSAKDDRLDGYVEDACRLDAERLAVLGDRAAQDALLQRITAVDVSVAAAPSVRRGRRPVLVAAGAAAVALAASGLVLPGLLRPADPTGAQPGVPSASVAGPGSPAAEPSVTPSAPRGDVFGGSGLMSCIEEYNVPNLARRRFAFDGEVVRFGKGPVRKDPFHLYAPVTFRVNRWYRGGTGERVTVAMLYRSSPSVDNPTFGVGSRLLVSGEERWGGEALDDPIAWPCGFTRWHSEADAADWARAFG
ncbi:hypothetical protein ACFQY4_35945 [Catellatospora bangladeshensis]|uniref:Uncharacterized protein n=1 Tax=Catellatospora bangladeshensis TaxID=310355 RepID=A0A8J3JI21_9ACTN|nr:hypothetical protein [Catellatospora bangladeshensis]GIF81031.1 hypothetical protein Cba03nite_23800 [Catellatospora bangladeshensis]